jgi:hypothetical protein
MKRIPEILLTRPSWSRGWDVCFMLEVSCSIQFPKVGSYEIVVYFVSSSRQILFLYPHLYLQAVQMQVHSANGVMEGEAGRGEPISTPL